MCLAAALLAGGSAHADEAPQDPLWEEAKPHWCCRRPDNISAGTVGIYTGAAMVLADDIHLDAAVGSAVPNAVVAAQPILRGIGWRVGAGFRASYQNEDGWRLGGSIGAYRLGGLQLRDRRDSIELTLDRGVVFQVAPFVGKAFEGHILYPYIDLVGMLDTVVLEVTDASLGSFRLVTVQADIAPRVGVLLPIDGDWYVDFGAQHGLISFERIGGYLALGTWDDF